MRKRVIIADNRYSKEIMDLRRISYHNSSGFTVKDELHLANYCKWGFKDENGIVLAILSEQDKVLSCLRSNVYFDSQTHEASNIGFAGFTRDFVTYPVLDMTFAATLPEYFKGGLLSVLRYYMYLLHRHSVKSITGQVVKGSALYFTLQGLGYHFRETGNIKQDLDAVDTWTIACLDIQDVDKAIGKLRAKYDEAIGETPLMIS